MKKPNPQTTTVPKHYDILAGMFVAVLIISNIVSAKVIGFGPLVFVGGTLLFPMTYLFGDVLTEVYGYARTRRVIWIGFASLLLLSLSLMIVKYLPSADGWPHQAAYESILGLVPRIALASITAYLVGEFVNSFVLAKMKMRTRGKHLWSRTIGSTVVGQALDTVIFVAIAFVGILPTTQILQLMLTIYLLKVAVEVMLTPLTYYIVNVLKREEGFDRFDTDTDFSPLSINVSK